MSLSKIGKMIAVQSVKIPLSPVGCVLFSEFKVWFNAELSLDLNTMDMHVSGGNYRSGFKPVYMCASIHTGYA